MSELSGQHINIQEGNSTGRIDPCVFHVLGIWVILNGSGFVIS